MKTKELLSDMQLPHGRLLLLVFLLLVSFPGCTGRTQPEEVKVDYGFETRQEIKHIASLPGIKLDTLWRIEAQYLDADGGTLSTSRVEVVLAPGEWTSELAPLNITPGWTAFRNPGQFGDGAPDLAEALRIAPAPLEMRMSQRITALDQTEWIPVPAAAKGLQARLLEVCPLEVRHMRQMNYRPTGDVIALRRVKEEMRWREFRINGPCRSFAAAK